MTILPFKLRYSKYPDYLNDLYKYSFTEYTCYLTVNSNIAQQHLY